MVDVDDKRKIRYEYIILVNIHHHWFAKQHFTTEQRALIKVISWIEKQFISAIISKHTREMKQHLKTKWPETLITIMLCKKVWKSRKQISTK